MTSEEGPFVLVRGVVYQRVRASQWRNFDYVWLRASLPPDGTPGKRSKWPPRYSNGRLPAHEEIDPTRAKVLISTSLERLEKLRSEAMETHQ